MKRRPFLFAMANAFGCLAITMSTDFSASADAGEVASALKVGDQAPDFDLPTQGSDNYVSLSELIKDGPVVVVVLRGYPGYQCGICKRQTSSMLNRAKAIESATGGKPNRVVLVYPGAESGLSRQADQFMGSRQLPKPFVMVRDPDMQMVTQWGLRWKAPRETAYPSTYVIGPGRRVKWAKVSDSHAGRATVEEVLKAIKRL